MVSVLFALAMAAAPPPVMDTGDSVDRKTRRRIERTLEKEVKALLREGNRRGVYSRRLHRVDESAYEVTFHRDEARDDRLITERLLLTLRGNADGKDWTIVSEEVQDTYDGLVRHVPGDETFHRFDSLRLEREGFRIEGGPGALWIDYLEGLPSRAVITADSLGYRYEPPSDSEETAPHTYRYLVEERPEDFVFEPERVSLACTPDECRTILGEAFEGLRPMAPESVGPALRDAYAEFRDAQEKARAENPFRGFGRGFQDGHRSWSIAVKRKGTKDHWLWLRYDNWAGWEITFGNSRLGPILAYYAENTRNSGIPAYTLEWRADRGARDFDLLGIRGTVALALGNSRTMEGDLTFTLEARRPLREVAFRIDRTHRTGRADKHIRDPSLFVNSVEDGDGTPLTWVKAGPGGGIIVLARQVEAGTEVELRLHFENRRAIGKLSPSYSAVSRSGWLPFVRFADMIDEWDVTIMAPARYEVLSIGERVAEWTQDDVGYSRWIARHPVNFPTVIFGKYVEREPRFSATRKDGTEIPVTIRADRHGMQDWDIRPRQLPTLAEEAVNALNLYRGIFGVDYPYSKLDLVNDPLGFLYGQSPASIVYVGSGAFRGEGVLGTLGGAAYTTFAKSLVAHEVGHQWWGGLVLNANRRNYWFVESLAEYSSALFVEAVDGREDPGEGWSSYLLHVLRWRDQILQSSLVAPVQHATSLWSGDYYTALYAKGPYAFHMLRVTFGDEKMFRFLKLLATELAGREIVTRDIQRVAERAFGTDMDWFFDQWIRGAGLPEFDFEFQVQPTEDGAYLVRGVIRQRVVLGRKKKVLDGVYYRGLTHVAVTVRDSEAEFRVPVLVEGAETPFVFKVPEEPTEVVLNKYGEMLAHDVSLP